MRRFLFGTLVFISGILVGGVSSGAILATSQFKWFDIWYSTAVNECLQRVYQGGNIHLNEIERASQSIDQAIANQMLGLISGPISGREYTEEQVTALRFIRAYMDFHPERFESVLTNPLIESFPPLGLEELEARCLASGVCDSEMVSMMLRLHAQAQANAPDEEL